MLSYINKIGPEWLAHLADAIFEGIPKEVAPQFRTDLLSSIPVGRDLEPVRWKLAILRHKKQLVALKDSKEEYVAQVRKAIQQVIAYCEAKLEGTATGEQRRSAWSAADSAAERATARSAAQSVADSAAWSVRLTAHSASVSAERSARSAQLARSAHYEWERDTLLSLLRDL